MNFDDGRYFGKEDFTDEKLYFIFEFRNIQ